MLIVTVREVRHLGNARMSDILEATRGWAGLLRIRLAAQL